MKKTWAAVLVCLAVLPLAGCSPLTKGAVGVARTGDGRLVAVVFSCEKEDAELRVTAPTTQRVTPGGRLEEQLLYEVSAEVGKGATVMPLDGPAATDTRPLRVSVWGDDEGVNLGRLSFARDELPVVADPKSPSQVAVFDTRPRQTPSTTPAASARPTWLESHRIRVVTHDEFVTDAGEICD